MLRNYLTLFFFSISIWTQGQSGAIFGKVENRRGEILENVHVLVTGGRGTHTNEEGKYELQLPAGKYLLTFSHVGFKTKKVSININENARIKFDLKLRDDPVALKDIQVQVGRIDENLPNNQLQIEAKTAKVLPSAFSDFSKILVTLPQVASNNEFSTAYSVRGGNFDENLVYVNDIPVYRPFLSNAGRQEGLSFVNPQMVNNIRFSAGGWESKYGDKLSSTLNILYQEPDILSGNLTMGLLGGSATIGQRFNDRFRVITGIRHKDSRYLLGTTEIDGQYFPTYSDIQSLMTFDLTPKEKNQINKTKLHWLLYYGRNRYLTQPVSQITQFGSILANFRIQTAFQGQEILNYDVYQTGLNLSHIWSENWLTRVISSGVYTVEREYFDVLGSYRLCDVDEESNGLNDCILVRGIGTNYDYGRNQLSAKIANVEIRNEHLLNLYNTFEWGIGWQKCKYPR